MTARHFQAVKKFKVRYQVIFLLISLWRGGLLSRSFMSVGLSVQWYDINFLFIQKERFRDYGGQRRLSEDSELVLWSDGFLVSQRFVIKLNQKCHLLRRGCWLLLYNHLFHISLFSQFPKQIHQVTKICSFIATLGAWGPTYQLTIAYKSAWLRAGS